MTFAHNQKGLSLLGWLLALALVAFLASTRSEERRVGKEWRCGRDWSSDVCSSDLQPPAELFPGGPDPLICAAADNTRRAGLIGLAAIESASEVAHDVRTQSEGLVAVGLAVGTGAGGVPRQHEIGRASCRERVEMRT